MNTGGESRAERLRRLRDILQALLLANEQAERRLVQEMQSQTSLHQEVERVRTEMERQSSESDREKK